MVLQAQQAKQELQERLACVEQERNKGQQELIALHKQAATDKDVSRQDAADRESRVQV
jgi:hypothetical protein